jgi:hypothetical protein
MEYINLERALPFGKNLTVTKVPCDTKSHTVGDWETIVRSSLLVNAVKNATLSDIILTNELGDEINLSDTTNIDDIMFPMSKSAYVSLTCDLQPEIDNVFISVTIYNFARRPADSIFISPNSGPIIDPDSVATKYAKLVKMNGEQFKLKFTDPRPKHLVSFQYNLSYSDFVYDKSSSETIFNAFKRIPLLSDVTQSGKDTIRAFAFEDDLMITVTEISDSKYQLFANSSEFGELSRDYNTDFDVIDNVKDILRTFKNYHAEKERLERLFK